MGEKNLRGILDADRELGPEREYFVSDLHSRQSLVPEQYAGRIS